MTELGPCTLIGKYVKLEPLEGTNAEALLAAGRGVDWSWMSSALASKQEVQTWVKAALENQKNGGEVPFVVKLRSGSRLVAPAGSEGIIGSTRYMDIQASSKGVEVGWTWYSPSMQGTVVNPECKFLMLRHAFEDWGAIRVQLKTDVNNARSQRAILKLGAKFEGRLRNHRIRRDGTFRDTMMYSITKDEWRTVRTALVSRINSWRPV